MSQIITRIEASLYKDGVAQEDYDFTLTADQTRAVEAIMAWYNRRMTSPAWKRYFVLAGAAGTGKSSLIRYIIANLNLADTNVLCCAYTGKASLNMQRKGSAAATIHSSMYDVKAVPGKDPIFVKKQALYYRLVIVDEASMISEDIFSDLLSFNVPVIFIGDHCQLPPIEGEFNIMLEPDFTLNQIMRQAEKSPIIRASQLAIRGQILPYGDYGDYRKIGESEMKETDILWADQIITGYNKSRRLFNAVCRDIRGLKERTPQVGERMIVLRNNSRFHLYNGQIVHLMSESYYDYSTGNYNTTCLDEIEYGDALHGLLSRPKEISYKLREPTNEDFSNRDNTFLFMDYGYAISCHKSQGSGWERVLVYDEGFGGDEDTRRRWLYTAITRAKKQLLIVKKE